MTDDWPEERRRSREERLEEDNEMPDNENEVSFTNDHGTIYMVGDTDNKDEWLWFDISSPSYDLRA
jgi:hypothetical protein